MNDLLVSEAARGTGVAYALILACADEGRTALSLDWQTTKTNKARRSEKSYRGHVSAVGADDWFDYSLGAIAQPGVPGRHCLDGAGVMTALKPARKLLFRFSNYCTAVLPVPVVDASARAERRARGLEKFYVVSPAVPNGAGDHRARGLVRA